MFSTEELYSEVINQFSFLKNNLGFKVVADKNENMFVFIEYVNGETSICINYDRRDNYLAVSATNLRIQGEEFIHRFENVEKFPNEIQQSAKKVKAMCSRFLN